MVGVYENILLIKPSSLGDVVMALPSLSALRRSFPQARIHWLIRPEFAPLIEGHPHVDEILLFDRTFLAKAWHSAAAGRGLLSLVSDLRHRRFDAVLDLQGLLRTGLLAWLSGCRQRFGPRWREMAHLFYTTSVPPQLEWIHVVDYYLKLVEAMGGSDLRAEFVLPERPKARAVARDLLSRHKIDLNRYAVVIPGSAQTSKCWPVERFAALVDRLASEHGLAVVATGGKAENDMIETIRKLAKHPPANLAMQTAAARVGRGAAQREAGREQRHRTRPHRRRFRPAARDDVQLVESAARRALRSAAMRRGTRCGPERPCQPQPQPPAQHPTYHPR